MHLNLTPPTALGPPSQGQPAARRPAARPNPCTPSLRPIFHSLPHEGGGNAVIQTNDARGPQMRSSATYVADLLETGSNIVLSGRFA